VTMEVHCENKFLLIYCNAKPIVDVGMTALKALILRMAKCLRVTIK